MMLTPEMVNTTGNTTTLTLDTKHPHTKLQLTLLQPTPHRLTPRTFLLTSQPQQLVNSKSPNTVYWCQLRACFFQPHNMKTWRSYIVIHRHRQLTLHILKYLCASDICWSDITSIHPSIPPTQNEIVINKCCWYWKRFSLCHFTIHLIIILNKSLTLIRRFTIDGALI